MSSSTTTDNRSERCATPPRPLLAIATATFVVLLATLPGRALAQEYDPPYPRINMLVWGGASPAWYAEFDWAIVAWSEPNRRNMEQARVINPDLVVSGTTDVNACECFMPNRAPCPDEWRVKAPGGGDVDPYGTPSLHLGNTSATCGLYEGRTYSDAVVEHALEQDWSTWQGWNSDGLWGPITWLALDLNEDGVEDSEDREIWRAGRLDLLSRLRDALGEDAIITAWAGAAETFWDEGPAYLNGVGVEEFMRYQSWHKINEAYETYFTTGRDRRFFYISNSWLMDPSPDASAKENFQYMRFGLATTLQRDGFYSYTAEQANGGSGHMWVEYYDEYDVPLGYPLADAVALEEGVFCRFFDGGVMLLNATASDRVVHEGQLIAAAEGLGLVWDEIAGEQGHYYRFSGQQNPTENDGSVVTEITLRGEEAHWGRPRGDGVLLVRSPNLVVAAAVIIDTQRFSTSPAAQPATTEGFTGSCGEDGRQGFRVGYGACSEVNPLRGYHVSPAGQSSEATFEANLVHAGPYRVYEFHPQTDGHDVPHIIDHEGGADTIYVDQTTDGEQWNLLGTFHFTATEPARVTISAMASGTEVAADAIRFEYAGEPGTCGNAILDFGEACDSARPISGSCEDLGYDGGILACAADCSGWDESGCTGAVNQCGDGELQPGEVCDGAALGGETCESRGYTGGTLACGSDCQSFDESNCEGAADQQARVSGGCATCQTSGSDSPAGFPLVMLVLLALCTLSSRRRQS